MKLTEILKAEFSGFGRYERILFPLAVITIGITAFNGSKIALIAAVCGISYTILAGKGRVSCYFIGISGTLCYAYLAFKSAFYGNLALYALYYFPMEIIGIFKWSRHLKKNSREIEKRSLSNKEIIIYFSCTFVLSCIASLILHFSGGKTPLLDGFTLIFSILGLLLTVKRCIEQWHIWFLVNLLSFIMWLGAYINGSNCLAIVLMWLVYLVLGVYFLFSWRKEMKNQ